MRTWQIASMGLAVLMMGGASVQACPSEAGSIPVADKVPESQPATQKAAYSCPMHPEVTSDKPGKCSKCGMDLVKQAETPKSGHEKHNHGGNAEKHPH